MAELAAEASRELGFGPEPDVDAVGRRLDRRVDNGWILEGERFRCAFGRCPTNTFPGSAIYFAWWFRKPLPHEFSMKPSVAEKPTFADVFIVESDTGNRWLAGLSEETKTRFRTLGDWRFSLDSRGTGTRPTRSPSSTTRSTRGKPALSYADSVEEAIGFGWIDGVKRKIDDERYSHRFSPRRPESEWSPTNVRRAEKLLAEGLVEPPGQALIDEGKRRGKWKAAAEKAAKPVPDLPEELAVALRKNQRAAKGFDALTPACQRQYILWIADAKRTETREKRAKEATKLLAEGKKL